MPDQMDRMKAITVASVSSALMQAEDAFIDFAGAIENAEWRAGRYRHPARR